MSAPVTFGPLAADGGTPVRERFLPVALPSVGEAEKQAVLETLESGWVTTGPKAIELGRRIAESSGAAQGLAVNSCTGELHLALASWGIVAGQPADYDALRALSDRYGLKLLADAAHSFGARWRGRPVGSLADATCFSFYAIKNITTGEGGCLVSDDAEFLAKAQVLSLHGISKLSLIHI